jgi:hypothetical protein
MAALVSIVTRTLGRPCVADAAASVAAQTYRPLEWVVVDASGNGVDVPAAGDVPVRVVSTGAPMLRSVAGNAGFGGVSGRRLAILDDDDLLMPTFVERLSAALDAHPQAGVAYGNVRVETDRPDVAGLYAFEYSELLLLRRNLFPPNAALVDAALVRERGIRFDTGLDVLEDWDFWLQASSHAPFVHVREVLAIYRLWLSGSGCLGHRRAGGAAFDALGRGDGPAAIRGSAAGSGGAPSRAHGGGAPAGGGGACRRGGASVDGCARAFSLRSRAGSRVCQDRVVRRRGARGPRDAGRRARAHAERRDAQARLRLAARPTRRAGALIPRVRSTMLVSVVTRTLGRPCLADAATSVAAQTHRPLEWVLVDASGRGVDVPPAGDVPIRVATANEPLPRARAANLGLDAAKGARAR